jgi:thiamine biosynthesis protein ThiS
MELTLTINGQARAFSNQNVPATLEEVIVAMNLKTDRVAVEHNGTIAPRARWSETTLANGDRIEIVHFVGGGTCRTGAGQDRSR